MGQATDEQRARYPLAAYSFRVRVGDVSMSFSEVSGITVQYDHVVYAHGLSFLEGATIETVAVDRFTSVTCRRGTVLAAAPLFLYEWLKKRDLRSMDVSLCDTSGAAALSWKIRAAVPVKLTAPTFRADTNEISVDTLDLMAKGVSVGKP